jgi:hypothetical protein
MVVLPRAFRVYSALSPNISRTGTPEPQVLTPILYDAVGAPEDDGAADVPAEALGSVADFEEQAVATNVKVRTNAHIRAIFFMTSFDIILPPHDF